MFSSDKNVETIGQLVEVLKHYIGLQIGIHEARCRG